MLQTTRTVTASLKKRIAEQNGAYHCEIESLMKMLTLDIFSLAFLSLAFGCCENLRPCAVTEAFHRITDDVANRVQRPLRAANFVYWWPNRRNRQIQADIDLLRPFVRERLESRRDCGGEGEDLLSKLLAGYDEDTDSETLQGMLIGSSSRGLSDYTRRPLLCNLSSSHATAIGHRLSRRD